MPRHEPLPAAATTARASLKLSHRWVVYVYFTIFALVTPQLIWVFGRIPKKIQ